MDPRFDPTCKPIPDNRSKSRRNTAVGSDDEKKSEGYESLDEYKLKSTVGDLQLTSKEAQQMIIDQRKNKIENRYSSPYANKYQQIEKQP